MLLFRNRFVKLYLSQILQFTIQSGCSKAYVATFVATKRMWLDTTGEMSQEEVENPLIRSAVSNLVAIRHMWRMTFLMWRQAQFFPFHILGNFKDHKPYVQ
jgi:hypothetical protein